MSSRDRASSDVPGRLLQRIVVLASALLIFSFASTSHAYSWMIRHGYAKCASCHTDPMGGETLTGFGRVMGDTTLPTRWGEKETSNKGELFFGIAEPRELNVGGGIRYMDLLYQFPKGPSKSITTTFPMQLDAYGQVRLFDHLRIAGSLGVSKVQVTSNYNNAALLTSNKSGGDRPWNLLSRNHWLGYDISDHVLVRAGRLNLPFGIRMPEHTMWVRSATLTDRESSQQHGVAVDYSEGRWRGELMGILGNYQLRPDKFRERGYSLYAEYLLGPHAGIGVSSLVAHAQDDRLNPSGTPYTRQAHGLTARYSPVEPVVILAEGDVLLNDQKSAGYTGMIQGDYEFAQGFHAMLTGEILDGGKTKTASSQQGAGQAALGGWVTFNWYFYTHFDMRLDFFARQNGAPTFLSQIHYYF